MPSRHLILCCPLFLLPPIPLSIRVFSNESTLCMRWPKYWSFSFSIIPSKEHPGLIAFWMLLEHDRKLLLLLFSLFLIFILCYQSLTLVRKSLVLGIFLEQTSPFNKLFWEPCNFVCNIFTKPCGIWHQMRWWKAWIWSYSLWCNGRWGCFLENVSFQSQSWNLAINSFFLDVSDPYL